MGTLDVTRLLEQHASGDEDASARLFPLLYRELRAMAQAMMGSERREHTLQATAVVHEAYIRLFGRDKPLDFRNKRHFFSSASREMRRVLVEHARNRKRQCREGSHKRIPLDRVSLPHNDRAPDLLALEAAMKQLAEIDPEKVSIVEMRYFGGLTIAQIAHVLDMPVRTVERKWAVAKSRLHVLINGKNAPLDSSGMSGE